MRATAEEEPRGGSGVAEKKDLCGGGSVTPCFTRPSEVVMRHMVAERVEVGWGPW